MMQSFCVIAKPKHSCNGACNYCAAIARYKATTALFARETSVSGTRMFMWWERP